MDRRHPYPLSAAAAAIAVGFTICAAAGEHIEHVATQADFSPGSSPSVAIKAALARVDAARSRAGADPAALEDALTALGDASLEENRNVTAADAYAEALRLAEQHGGLQSERLLAPLLGLGKTLAASGHHQEAVVHLQRALTIMRAQYGLFDLRQQETLKSLAASLTALDRVPEAQELMIYRVRAAEKAYGEGNPKVIPAACDLGDWFGEVGMAREARMAYYMALNIVGTTKSLNAPIIVEPLRGIARTRMREQSYPQSTLHRSLGPILGPPIGPTTRNGRSVPLNPEGEAALKKALRIIEANPQASLQTQVETLIQMGDWYQIKKLPREALPYYKRAWQLSRTAPYLPSSASTTLNVPVRVYYPTPQIVADAPAVQAEEVQSHYVQVEFTVAADGSVRDARIVDHDTSEGHAQEIFDAVRASRFRPKFVDGQAVAAPGIAYREVFWTGD